MAGSYGSTDDKSMDLLHESIRVNEESQLVGAAHALRRAPARCRRIAGSGCEALRLAHTGTATMGQLKDQREQLERARDQVSPPGARSRPHRRPAASSPRRAVGARTRGQNFHHGCSQRQVGETGDRAREARSAMNQIADNIFREKVGLWFTIAVVFTIDVLLAYRLGTNKGRLFR